MRSMHFLIDRQDNTIITHERITGTERKGRNKEARDVGEIFLHWIPALIFILLTPTTIFYAACDITYGKIISSELSPSLSGTSLSQYL